jgi:hypothetical protein
MRLNMIVEMKFVHPKDMQDGEIEIQFAKQIDIVWSRNR